MEVEMVKNPMHHTTANRTINNRRNSATANTVNNPLGKVRKQVVFVSRFHDAIVLLLCFFDVVYFYCVIMLSITWLMWPGYAIQSKQNNGCCTKPRKRHVPWRECWRRGRSRSNTELKLLRPAIIYPFGVLHFQEHHNIKYCNAQLQ